MNFLMFKLVLEKAEEIDGETVVTVSDFFWGGSKITEDGDCSHEIKRCLLPGRKVMTNLDSIFKRRDITLTTKVRPVLGKSGGENDNKGVALFGSLFHI